MLAISVLMSIFVQFGRAQDQPWYSHPVERMPFQVGEKLSFKIRYGFIKAGTAQMKVVGIIKDRFARPALHIQTTARSLSSFDWIYKVRDEVNSYFDLAGFFPYRYEKKLREGGYKADLFVDYFHDDTLARVHTIRYTKKMKIKKENKYQVKIPSGVFDVLSAFYYVRSQDLKVGQSLYFDNHEKDKIYSLEVKVYRREKLKVSAGKFQCLVIEPLLQGEGIFKQKGRLTVWLTDDQYKIPVQMTSEVAVGHITTELVKIEGVDGRISARIK